MRFFSFIFLAIFTFSYNSLAEVDQALIDNVYKMSRPEFEKDGNTVSRPVQTLHMLAHELSLYADERTATAAAKSIISMAAKGEGARGGLRKTTSGPRRFLNITEKEMVKEALTKAADYLYKQHQLDTFLESSMGGMLTAWDDGETKKHGSIVLSLLMAAREKLDSNDIGTAKARVIGLIPETADTLFAQVTDNSNWRSAAAYLAASNPRHHYNAIEWRVLEEAREAELAVDKRDHGITDATPKDYFENYYGKIFTLGAPLTVGNRHLVKDIADRLSATRIPEKAYTLRMIFTTSLMNKETDLRSLTNPISLEEIEFRRHMIRALTAMERFKKYELAFQGLDVAAPKVTDYQDLGVDPNTESQAILLALATVVQKLITHPMSNVNDLRDFFVFQRNDSEIKNPLTRDALTTFNFEQFINEDLISQVQDAMRVRLPISERQVILIDQQALEHRLIYEAVPEFNFESGQMTTAWRYLRKIRSRGDGWCGYYTLRNIANSKAEYKRRIADNLKIPFIRTAVLQLTGVGNEVYSQIKRGLGERLYEELSLAADMTITQADLLRRINEKRDEQAAVFPQYEAALAAVELLQQPEKALVEKTYRYKAKVIEKLLEKEKRLEIEKREKEALKKSLDDKDPVDDEDSQDDEDHAKNIALFEQALRVRELENQLKKLQGDKLALLLELEATAPLITLASPNLIDRITTKGILTAEQAEIIKEIERLTAAQEEEMRARWPHGISADQSEAARLVRENREKEKEPLYTALARTAPLSDEDLATRMSKEIDTIDYGQFLNMGANVAWQDQPFTFPFINGLLTHDDMYVWIQTKKRNRWGFEVQPSVYENGKYMLATFVSARNIYPYHARRIHLFNTDGAGHYDKWVEDDDYADLADALRHKKLYSLAPTRPIRLY